MKRLALQDRPREKLARIGVHALGDNELVALILGHGYCRGTTRRDALEIANELLDRTGGIHGLARHSHAELITIKGLGDTKAAQLLAALELGRRTLVRPSRGRLRLSSPRDIAEYLLPQFGARTVEHFGIVLLDTQNQLLKTSIISIGSLDATVVHPREVFREAVVRAAARIVLFHNHPSGDPTPSDDDVDITARLVAGGRLMGIDVIDHLILSETGYISLRKRGCF